MRPGGGGGGMSAEESAKLKQMLEDFKENISDN